MFELVRPILAFLWTDRCTITKTETNRDEDGISEPTDVIYAESEPCRISFKTLVTPTESTDTAAERVQDTTLFIRPDLAIPAGSKIIVTRNGVSTQYSNSGQPKLYDSHQEISLTVDEDKP